MNWVYLRTPLSLYISHKYAILNKNRFILYHVSKSAVFWDRVSLCVWLAWKSLYILGWPQTCSNTPASVSWGLRLQVCTATPSSNNFVFHIEPWHVNPVGIKFKICCNLEHLNNLFFPSLPPSLIPWQFHTCIRLSFQLLSLKSLPLPLPPEILPNKLPPLFFLTYNCSWLYE